AFYTNWNGNDLKGCANDVAAELIKLKKENIEGLILDLRFNGGGSIKEAIEFAGIFINVGPLMVLQAKGQPLFTLKDTTPGAAYSGPLVIIVNGLSASASEMVAASLQDHQRALIVGTPTFGKSNGQSLIPIIEKDTTAHVKATTVRLYRITGKSYQQKGVQPDIVLPDFSQHLGYSEKKLPRSLPTDSILKKTYYTPLPIPSLSDLRKKSNQRTSQNKFFQQFAKPMAHQRYHIPLEIKAFARYCVENSKGFEIIASLKTTTSLFSVSQNRFNNILLRVDENRNNQDIEFAHELEQSPYLQEVFQILVDYIELENRK
ncbi:MAG: carboxy terminal-processing peptidase, partial [Flammeovirgaceae bacterium]